MVEIMTFRSERTVRDMMSKVTLGQTKYQQAHVSFWNFVS